jgi:hypothetical protein
VPSVASSHAGSNSSYTGHLRRALQRTLCLARIITVLHRLPSPQAQHAVFTEIPHAFGSDTAASQHAGRRYVCQVRTQACEAGGVQAPPGWSKRVPDKCSLAHKKLYKTITAMHRQAPQLAHGSLSHASMAVTDIPITVCELIAYTPAGVLALWTYNACPGTPPF